MTAAGVAGVTVGQALAWAPVPHAKPAFPTRESSEMNALKHLMQRSAAALLALAMAMLLLVQAQQVQAETVHGITADGIFSVDSVSGGPATQLVKIGRAHV